MPKNLVTEVSFIVLFPTLISGKVTFLLVKSQKDAPLCPIISPVGTVTYDIAKWMNSVITPYMPQEFMINCTNDFIKIAQTVKDSNFLASLDVEGLLP